MDASTREEHGIEGVIQHDDGSCVNREEARSCASMLLKYDSSILNTWFDICSVPSSHIDTL